MQPAGYSQTPLVKKLGIKPGFTIRLVNQPDYYFDLFADWPDDVKIARYKRLKKNFIHYFVTEYRQFEKKLPGLKAEIVPDGMIWISWPKKTAKVLTDMDEGRIRDLALRSGLVDVKVCAVDAVWSGLKLVIPVGERATLNV